MPKRYKYVLVLSGGGFKGAFQVGAINYLRENWKQITGELGEMRFDIVAGVSVGSLNGVMVAMNKLDQLNALWAEIANDIEQVYTSDFIDTKYQGDKVKFRLDVDTINKRLLTNLKVNVNLWKGLGLLLSKKKRQEFIKTLLQSAADELSKNLSRVKSLADNTPLKNLLIKYVDVKDIQEKCDFLCGYVSLTDGEYINRLHRQYINNEEFIKGILASTAMPVIWDPVALINFGTHQVTNLVDGGIRNVSPLGDVITLINNDQEDVEYKIFVINCNSGKVELETQPNDLNIAQIALRSLNDIAITEIFNNDLEQFLRINDILLQAREVMPGVQFRNFDYRSGTRDEVMLKYFKSYVIQPDTGVLGDTLLSNPTIIQKRIEHGREKARKVFGSSQV